MGDGHRLVLVGGGGHARCLYEIASADMDVVGYVAPVASRLSELGVSYLGDDEVRHVLARQGIRRAALGIAGARDNAHRRRLFDAWHADGFVFGALIHPSAVVSPSAAHGTGLQCLAGAVINPAARLGVNVIVNTNATVEHDCVLGDHVHVAPGATLCGGVSVGESTLVGAGAVVIPGTRIGRRVIIGAGAVVTADVADDVRVAGVPAVPMSSASAASEVRS